MKTTFNLACSHAKFDELIVLPETIADTCLMDRNPSLPERYQEWFRNYVNWRVRWFYTNSLQWRKALKKDDPRDYLYQYINHWTVAYLISPDEFITLKRRESLGLADPEWKPNGLLNS